MGSPARKVPPRKPAAQPVGRGPQPPPPAVAKQRAVGWNPRVGAHARRHSTSTWRSIRSHLPGLSHVRMGPSRRAICWTNALGLSPSNPASPSGLARKTPSARMGLTAPATSSAMMLVVNARTSALPKATARQTSGACVRRARWPTTLAPWGGARRRTTVTEPRVRSSSGGHEVRTRRAEVRAMNAVRTLTAAAPIRAATVATSRISSATAPDAHPRVC